MTTVYWSAQIDLFTSNAHEPVNILKTFDDTVIKSPYSKCPAVQNMVKNTYAFLSAFEMDLEWDWESKDVFRIECPNRGQDFFDNAVTYTEMQEKIFQLSSGYILFSEEPLTITQMPVFGSNCELNNNASLLAGEYDIGRWFRRLNAAYYIKKNKGSVFIKNKDPLYFVRFEKPVKLKRFLMTKELMDLSFLCTNLKETTQSVLSLDYSYQKFKELGIRKRILKEIKKNLI
jgi:hypothetical protein